MAYEVPKLDDFSPASLDKAVQELLAAVRQEADGLSGENDWKNFRDRWIARKNGILTQVNDLWLKAAPGPAKRDVGARVNQLKGQVEQAVEAAQQKLASSGSAAKLDAERVDVTLPGIRRPLGAEHPMLRTMNEVVGVFRAMGYSVAEGPEIETDYYNFEALNFPPNHPARDTQDTLFVAGQEKKPQRDRLLLRTHTSPVQIRSMLKQPPPIRVVIPGKVHRADTADATHSPIFHQVEGLAVDTNITFSDLKGTLDHAMKSLFGSNVKTRFFPSFFPFTEPSADVSITCFKCGGKGCRLCKMSGWIELLGCGMVDPNVFKFVEQNGYDSQKISGFAFGMGVERITMLKYGIDDIQLFYQGDVRFLEQFA
ncbi:MAG TPA: phenylalanine--tRNA ligase subunit alpha [Candidatus Limnocylindrales bacterium]|jgi:phenylalanyl-tRNA synthetase alpha chain|nr:phenylalanine--tRNA ligase subunit alpha [Candidatus Limnocylindrales bacterium]